MSTDSSENNTPPKPALEILTGFWLHLRPHVERNSVFIVVQELDLLDVASRVAADDVGAISAWIQGSQIVRPTPHQIETWDQVAAKSFRFVIVQPYVLIQEEGH